MDLPRRAAPVSAGAPASAALDRWPVAGIGLVALGVAVGSAPDAARAAASQVWPPFVLVTGLLLVGLVADRDGVFARAGRALADVTPGERSLFLGACLAVAVVTAVLNLDTAVVFLTPVLVHAARRRDAGGVRLAVACILVADAASLLLPGSNLTNLLVLGHLHLTGGAFLARTALPWVMAVTVTVAAVALLGGPWTGEPPFDAGPGVPEPRGDAVPPGRPVLGSAAVAATAVLVVVLRDPSLPVLVVGAVAVAARLATGRLRPGDAGRVLGVPVLVALFGVAVAFGTLGRTWSGPSALLVHLDAPATTAVGALASVLVDNLPAASLLAARTPPHPVALLVGLDVGPNLFVTGSLAWALWWRTSRAVGVRPPLSRALLVGAVSSPVAMAAAVLALGGAPGH